MKGKMIVMMRTEDFRLSTKKVRGVWRRREERVEISKQTLVVHKWPGKRRLRYVY